MVLPPRPQPPVQGENLERLTIGVDVDGVIGDQLADALPRIEKRLGIALSHNDVTEFHLPLGDTDLGREIEFAQTDAQYLLNMPVYAGARELIDELRQRYRVVLITARPKETLELTRRWLEARELKYDSIISAREEAKSIYGVDVLIDDYTGNIRDFLDKTDGLGILVDRPWNRRDRATVAASADRFAVVHSFSEIPWRVAAFQPLRGGPTE